MNTTRNKKNSTSNAGADLGERVVFLANDSVPINVVAQVRDILGLDKCSKIALGLNLRDVVHLRRDGAITDTYVERSTIYITTVNKSIAVFLRPMLWRISMNVSIYVTPVEVIHTALLLL